MQLQTPIIELLDQLRQVLNLLPNTAYTTPVPLLSKGTIGQHTRHVIEFYLELNKGYTTGIVNYDKRKRDHIIETDKQAAIQKLHEISHDIDKPDRSIILVASFHGTEPITVDSNYFRELIYNLEHTIHHMALMRVGIEALTPLRLPETFGVAGSTQKFREACAQ